MGYEVCKSILPNALRLADVPQSSLGPFASHWLEDGGGEPNPPDGGDALAASWGAMRHASTAATSTNGLQSGRSACSGALRPAMNALAPIAKLSGCDLSARASDCPSDLVRYQQLQHYSEVSADTAPSQVFRVVLPDTVKGQPNHASAGRLLYYWRLPVPTQRFPSQCTQSTALKRLCWRKAAHIAAQSWHSCQLELACDIMPARRHVGGARNARGSRYTLSGGLRKRKTQRISCGCP